MHTALQIHHLVITAPYTNCLGFIRVHSRSFAVQLHRPLAEGDLIRCNWLSRRPRCRDRDTIRQSWRPQLR